MYSPKPHVSNGERARSERRTRWGPESQIAELNGLKTAITTAMTPEQLDVYALRFRIEEIGQKIHAGDPPPSTDSKRSSSPAPEYDTSGRRINTRQHRYRQCLEQERQALVGTALNTIPGYQRPRDLHSFKQPLFIEKVYIPVKDFPSINFIGQILGPRGQSLADLNNQSGAHIAIRGKGSVKEGRAGHFRGHRNTSTATDNEQQGPLHCLIRADTQEKVSHAKILINEVIEAAACENCGQTGHRHYFCTMPTRFVAHVTCHSCKNTGHVARDCPQKSMGPAKLPPWRKDRLARRPETTGPDAEFEQLMLEIGN
jgi:splicing factor 1